MASEEYPQGPSLSMAPTMPRIWHNRPVISRVTPAFVVLALGAALRFLFLQSRSLWFDEALSVLVAGQPLARLHWALMHFEASPPLYSALMHFWLALFGDPRLGLRLFSALCGIGALAAFRTLSARLLPERARLLALFLAAVSSYWLHLAQDGRVYALLSLIVVCQALLTVELTRKPTRKLWAAYAALGALGLYAHYFFGMMLATHAAWLFWRRPRERAAVLAAHAAIALAYLPWLSSFQTQFATHRGDQVVADPLTFRHLCDLIGTQFFDVTYLGLLLPSWFVPALGGLIFLACAASTRGDAADSEPRTFLLWHAAAFVILVAAAELLCGRPVTQARYFAPMAPFLFLLVALVLSRPGRPAQAARPALEALVAVGAVGYFVSGWIIDPHLDRLAAAIRSTDRRLPVVYLETYYYTPLRYYYLPERTHIIVAEASEGIDYRLFPPYDGVAARERLLRLGPCVLLDEKHILGAPAVSLADGAQVAGLIARSPLAAKK